MRGSGDPPQTCIGTLQGVPRSGRGSGQPDGCCSQSWHDHSVEPPGNSHGFPHPVEYSQTKQVHLPVGYEQDALGSQVTPFVGRAEGHVAALPPQLGSGGVTPQVVAVALGENPHVAIVVQCGPLPYSHAR